MKAHRFVCRAALCLLCGCLVPTVPNPSTPDFGAAADSGVPRDQATPDLVPPPDLMPPPDLAPQCRKQSDCAAGLGCVNGQCAPCVYHTDCDESQLCDVYLPQTGDGAGRCVAAAIIYVDNTPTTCPAANGTLANPYCTLSDAVAQVGAKTIIKLAASGKDYGGLSGAQLMSKTLAIFGPAGGSDGKAIATLGQGAGDAITIANGTDLTLDGVELRSGGARAIVGTVSGAQITLRRSRISGFAGTAIEVSRGTVNLDRVYITGNLAGVANLGINSRYAITNSIIYDNRIPSNNAAFVFSAASTGTFRYNTVVSNTRTNSANNEAGIDCGGVAQIEDSIVLDNNLFATVDGLTQFRNGCKLKNVVVGNDIIVGGITQRPDFESQSDLRLRETAASRACCIDKGTGPDTVDFFGNARKTTPDVGAHELR